MKCKVDTNNFILFTEAVYDSGLLWTIFNSFNVLMGVNVQTGRVTDVIALEDEKGRHYERIVTAFCYQDRWFFLPSDENKLIEVERGSNSIKYIALPFMEEVIQEAIFCNGYLCLFMQKVKKVVVLNLERMEIKMRIDLSELEVVEGKERWSIFWVPITYREMVYVALENTNCFLKIDLKRMEWQICVHNDMIEGIQDVYVTESNIYLLGNNGSIKKINVITGEAVFLCQSDEKECAYSRIIYLNDRLWLLPAFAQDICVLTDDGKKEKIFSFFSRESKGYFKTRTSTYHVCNEYICVFPRTVNCFIIINTKTNECKRIDIMFSNELKVKIKEEKYYDFIFKEGNGNTILDLNDYIEWVKSFD